MTRGALTLAALAGLAACSGPGSSSTAIGHRSGTSVPLAPPAAWRCPDGGVTVRLDLDGDGRDDEVRVVPELAAATCLEIHATTAPPLLCREPGGDDIIQLELDAGGVVEELDAIACDPSGAAVTLVRPTAPPPTGINPSQIPTGRTFAGVLIGRAAPSGTALWLDGGDAYAAIVWRDGWRWFIVGA